MEIKMFENQTILHNGETIVKDIADIGDKYVTILDDKEVEVFVYSASTWSTEDPDAPKYPFDSSHQRVRHNDHWYDMTITYEYNRVVTLFNNKRVELFAYETEVVEKETGKAIIVSWTTNFDESIWMQ